MQVQQMFQWFLQHNKGTAESVDEIMSRGAEIVDLRSNNPIYGQFSYEELVELFYSEMILEVIRRNLKASFLPWDSSPQYALKIWAQENNIPDVPDEIMGALSPDEKMAQETAEIVAYLVEGGATEVIITTRMTSSGRIVAIMAIEPEEDENTELEDLDDELDPWALLGDEEFDEMVADFEGWDPDDFKVDLDEDDFPFDPDEVD